jgi:hypothetical protein
LPQWYRIVVLFRPDYDDVASRPAATEISGILINYEEEQQNCWLFLAVS